MTQTTAGDPAFQLSLSGQRAPVDYERAPTYSGMIAEKDVLVPMRDGVKIAVDIYRPDTTDKLPALLALSIHNKDLQGPEPAEASLSHPAWSMLWTGPAEAGDTRFFVARGYVHVIGNPRGIGKSEGGGSRAFDSYDLIEWIAAQPWCDGNVGMIGISYFATVQVMGAAEAPPHLKAIFVNGGHFDLYELCYHGGIMWLMPRASREGRGGDSGVAVRKVSNKSKRVYSPEEYQARIRARLADPDIAHWPNMVHVLNYPETHELWMDFILNPHDGPFWQDGQAIGNAHKVKIPAYFQVK